MCVFNEDQVPISISQTYVGNENDFRRLCTLDLVIPMKVEEDFSNLPKPGVGFSAKTFMAADD